jgi:acetylornithine/succinyldiaminopimelate/putrescine aminotransferase
MTRQAYSVWKNPSDSLAHTSTFGGNGICLTVVIETLRRHGHVDAEADAMTRAIDEDISVRTRAFRHHVNPYTATGMEIFGCNLDVEEASGGRLTLRDGRVIFDCAGGTGASLRGHNPPDVTSEVLAVHDSEHDYFEDLARELASLTPFPEVFPAVSGATAVDIALTLALLARPGRRRIVTFRGNYSGKSLPSMNFSKHGPTATASDQGAFDPYYPDVVYVDPFRADAVAAFEAAVAGDDVALVWFELSQGFHCLPLPDAVIEAVGAFKERHGYLVGVDEVLTGFWRTGPKFLAHEGRLECDLTTLAKPLSDMIMPFGVALATSSVVAAASAQNSEHVAMMRRRLRNGLGSHIALHALSMVNNPEALESRERAERLLTHGLARVAAQSPLFEGVAGTGIHVRLVPKRRWFPFHARSQVGQLLEASMVDLILSRCNVMVAQQRFFHALFAEEADVAEIITRLEAGTRKLTPLTVYRNVFARLRATARLRLSRGRRGPKGSTS